MQFGIRLAFVILPVCSGSPLLSDTVATVNGEAITSRELENVVRPQVAALEERVRQVRNAALAKLIDNLLLEQDARKHLISVDEYLRSRVESVTVPDADVERAYQASRDQFPGVLPAEAKYRVRRTLEDNARAAALRRVLDGLRQGAQVSNNLTANPVDVLEAASHEGPSTGSVDARVTIVEFSDFECLHCRAAQPIVQAVLKRWPTQVRHTFKHFPLDQHVHAMLAARAGVCAERQDRFWPVHDRIFAAPELSEAAIRNAASDARLRMPEFDECLQSEETEAHVKKDILVGRSAGVTGTPAFFVNGEPVSAAALEARVESILAGVK